jgi:hypothetical protein
MFPGNFTIFQNLQKQTFTDGFPAMNRHDRASSVRMPYKMVAAFYPDFFESDLP